jgi:hypothetical protein
MPHVLVLVELGEIVVAHGDIVDVGHFERGGSAPTGVIETEEHGGDIGIAAVAAIE